MNEFGTELAGGGFLIRPLASSDRAALAEAAADPLIWAGHPAKDRWKPAVFDRYFDFLLSAGGAVRIEGADGTVAGCSRFYRAADHPERPCIGFTFLTRAHWGGAANRAVKRLMLEHIFAGGDEAGFHIDPTNIRSQKATAKLGARLEGEVRLDLGTGEAPWLSYRLTEADWRASE